MSDQTRRQREYDRIAASRISKLGGGVPKHIALGSPAALSLRWKMQRMGLTGEHIDAAIRLVDEQAMQAQLQRQSIGVRFATMPQSRKRVKVWDVGIK
jgi:hypothetical protein